LVLDICNCLSDMGGFKVKIITFREQNEYPELSGNIEIEVIPSRINLSVFRKNEYNIIKLQKAIEDFSPDIIHTHLFEAEIVSRSCIYPNAKWFSHCHDNMIQLKKMSGKMLFNKRSLTNYFEKNYLLKSYRKNGGTHYIAISDDTANFLMDHFHYYPVDKLTNAINFSRFNANLKEKNRGNKLTIANIGSFVKKKNQGLLIDIGLILQERKIDFEINLFGEGETKKALEERVIEAGLEKNIFFRGNLSHIEKYLWETVLYVHTATYEPLGLVLLEAMAAGVPVITLDGKGNRDIIINGENGYLIDMPLPELFADKIQELWMDLEKYCAVSKNAIRFAEQYDIKIYTERLINLYKKHN